MIYFLSLIIWLAAINIAAYFFMWRDKIRAVCNEWRISEKTFFLLSLFGGFMGMHLAMKHFRHKTLHFSFKFIVVISAFLWAVIFPWLYFSFIFQYIKA